jgi:hypothetical protein
MTHIAVPGSTNTDLAAGRPGAPAPMPYRPETEGQFAS